MKEIHHWVGLRPKGVSVCIRPRPSMRFLLQSKLADDPKIVNGRRPGPRECICG